MHYMVNEIVKIIHSIYNSLKHDHTRFRLGMDQIKWFGGTCIHLCGK